MRKVSPGNPSPLMERKNQNTQNMGRLTKMFTERFDEVIFEPLLLIDNLVYLFIIFLDPNLIFMFDSLGYKTGCGHSEQSPVH